MPQTPVSNIDKAAVLIRSLGPGAQDKVLELLGPEFAGKLRPVLNAVTSRKDITVLTEQVLQEFRELQTEVRASVSDSPNLQRTHTVEPAAVTGERPTVGPANVESVRNHLDSDSHAIERAERKKSTDDTSTTSPGIVTLSKLPPAILGAALKCESPRMIATVLKQLPSEVSGKVLESLPSETRQTTFLMLADTVQVNPSVVQRVVEKLCQVCQTIDPADVEQQDRRLKSLIGILQSVERDERVRLLESLTERDPELGAQIDNLMYDYTDILRIEDRSVQKLLSQLEQRDVAMALKSASNDLREKVMKNLSERVRAALTEEMELLTGVTNAKADIARREIANVIRAQDKAGTLVWME